MKYTKEQRRELGRQIYEGEIKRYEAVEKYDISDYTAKDYMRMYRDANHLAPNNGNHSSVIIAAPSKSESSGIDELEAMSKICWPVHPSLMVSPLHHAQINRLRP